MIQEIFHLDIHGLISCTHTPCALVFSSFNVEGPDSTAGVEGSIKYEMYFVEKGKLKQANEAEIV